MRHYFTGEVGAAELKADLQGALQQVEGVEEERIEDMDEDFQVTAGHLVALCDDVLAGRLAAEDLHAIGLCLAASTHFTWDAHDAGGKRVGLTIAEWSAPEHGRPLTRDNIGRFRQRLLMGGDPFSQ